MSRKLRNASTAKPAARSENTTYASTSPGDQRGGDQRLQGGDHAEDRRRREDRRRDAARTRAPGRSWRSYAPIAGICSRTLPPSLLDEVGVGA